MRRNIQAFLLLFLMLFGTVSMWADGTKPKGEGTASSPYQVTSYAELLWLTGEIADNGNTSISIELMNDIKMTGNEVHLGDWEKNVAFAGTFDGKGYTLTDVICKDDQYALFPRINNGVVKNLKVVYSAGTSNVGFCGRAVESTIENCEVSAPNAIIDPVYNENHFGGIVNICQRSTVKGCISHLEMTSSTKILGGIAGCVVNGQNRIEQCINYGNITVTSKKDAGGICGDFCLLENGKYYYGDGYAGLCDMLYCTNNGDVTSGYCAGGMVAASKNVNEGSSKIEYCNNYGKVVGTERVGGIIGLAYRAKIKSCVNTGDVGQAGCAMSGGIVGDFTHESVRDCYTEGKLYGSQVGGVAGYSDGLYDISRCISMMTIFGDGQKCGGIVGVAKADNTINIVCNYFGGRLNNQNSGEYYGAIMGFGDVSYVNVHDNWARPGSYGAEGDKIHYSAFVGYTNSGPVTNNQFVNVELADGSLTYLINSKESTPVFFQNIDNGQTPDDRPVVDNTHGRVYIAYSCIGNAYTNSLDNKPTVQGQGHQFENGTCKLCGLHYDLKDQYEIATASDFYNAIELVNSGFFNGNSPLFEMTADIDLGQYNFPMGIDAEHPFTGTFDGCNNTVTCHFNTEREYAALFSHVHDATIRNLRVSGSLKTAADHAGGIIGSATGNTILEKCVSAINITSSKSFGGLVGSHQDDDTLTVTYCGYTGSASNAAGYGVGIVNDNAGSLSLTRSYSAGTYSNQANAPFVGGSNNTDWIKTARVVYFQEANFSQVNDIESYVETKKDAFMSGEMTYNLNVLKTDSNVVWHQSLASDSYPLPWGEKKDIVLAGGATLAKADGNSNTPIKYINKSGHHKVKMENNDIVIFTKGEKDYVETSNTAIYENGQLWINDLKITDYTAFMHKNLRARHISYNRQLLAGEICTFVFPFAVDVADLNGRVNELSSYKDGVITVKQVSRRTEAGKPYFFKSVSEGYILSNELEGEIEIKGTESGDDPVHELSNGARLVGSFYQKTFYSNSSMKYYLVGSNGSFYGGSYINNPFRAQLAIPSSIASGSLTLSFRSTGGFGTGIEKATIDNNEETIYQPVYNLSGQKVNTEYKGVVIKNGKKFHQK